MSELRTTDTRAWHHEHFIVEANTAGWTIRITNMYENPLVYLDATAESTDVDDLLNTVSIAEAWLKDQEKS